MIYAFGEGARLSPSLYAVAFDETEQAAKETISSLLAAGALPFSLTDEEQVLCQGLGIPLSTAGGRVLYLYALATAPASRGQGLLRTLLRETEARARAEGYLSLCLLPADAALADAYRRMGFSEELPAGASATPSHPGELSLRAEISLPAAEPIPTEECRAALGDALSPELFALTLSTMPSLAAVRIGAGVALTLRDDPRSALAVTPDLMQTYRRTSDHRLLVLPLSDRIPPIPEPLPR